MPVALYLVRIRLGELRHGVIQSPIYFSSLTVFAIKQVAHRLPSGFVRFTGRLAFIGIHALFGGGILT